MLKQAVDISLLCNKVRENTRKGMMIGRVMLKRLQSRWEKRMTKVQRLMRQWCGRGLAGQGGARIHSRARIHSGSVCGPRMSRTSSSDNSNKEPWEESLCVGEEQWELFEILKNDFIREMGFWFTPESRPHQHVFIWMWFFIFDELYYANYLDGG